MHTSSTVAASPVAAVAERTTDHTIEFETWLPAAREIEVALEESLEAEGPTPPPIARGASGSFRRVNSWRKKRQKRANKVLLAGLFLAFCIPHVIGLVIYSTLGTRACRIEYDEVYNPADPDCVGDYCSGPAPTSMRTFMFTIFGVPFCLTAAVAWLLPDKGKNPCKSPFCVFFWLAFMPMCIAWFMGHIFTTAAWFSSYPYNQTTFNHLASHAKFTVNGTSVSIPMPGLAFEAPENVKLDAMLAIAADTCHDSWMNHNPLNTSFTLATSLGDPPEDSSWCGGADSPEDDQRWFFPACSQLDPCIYLFQACDAEYFEALLPLVVLWTIFDIFFAASLCLFLLCAVCYEPGSSVCGCDVLGCKEEVV